MVRPEKVSTYEDIDLNLVLNPLYQTLKVH